MYYLRSEPFEEERNGRLSMTQDMAIFVDVRFPDRYYRRPYNGNMNSPKYLELFTTKSFDEAMKIRTKVGDPFQIYDENGVVL